ncbi:MAG: trehalose-6-phosphate synthase, partial [Chloroflexota bacterium]|nr:trehalose-6-phosphate synthase [Chloroflexota bacterium]
IVSNRGPFTFSRNAEGEFLVERGAGGLVTALGALAEQHEVLWIALAMSEEDRLWVDINNGEPQSVEGIYLQLVRPDDAAYEKYYSVIANPLLWFIQHQLWDSPRTPSITQETWDAWDHGYMRINDLLANAVADSLESVDRPLIIFPQDYHLYMLPHFLREHLQTKAQIQPFIHIPWPGPDAWRMLPKQIRESLLYSLLESDRIGFQTEKDAFNFVQTCRFYLPEVHSRGRRDAIFIRGREVNTCPYPISINIEKTKAIVQEPETQLLKSEFINLVGDCDLILRVDRIEPSKNILRGLEAYRTLLDVHPEYCGNVKMLCLLVPSRMEVVEYQDYLKDIMAEAGLINARFSDRMWEPIRIIVGDNYPRAIAAMQLYDVLLVNPLADGMNLVAKEGALVNQKEGVLILSEYAGAYYELSENVISVSPFDIYGTVEAMHRALTINLEERQRRAESLRSTVENAGVRQWFYDQVDDALSAFEKDPDLTSNER